MYDSDIMEHSSWILILRKTNKNCVSHIKSFLGKRMSGLVLKHIKDVKRLRDENKGNIKQICYFLNMKPMGVELLLRKDRTLRDYVNPDLIR